MDERNIVLEAWLEVTQLQVRVHAHQFNNHLTTLGTYATLLADHLAEDFEGLAKVRKIRHTLEALGASVSSLHSSIGRGQDQPTVARFAEIRDDCLKLLQTKFRGPYPLDVMVKGDWTPMATLKPQVARAVLFQLMTAVVESATAHSVRAALSVDAPARAFVMSLPGDIPEATAWRVAAAQDLSKREGWELTEARDGGKTTLRLHIP